MRLDGLCVTKYFHILINYECVKSRLYTVIQNSYIGGLQSRSNVDILSIIRSEKDSRTGVPSSGKGYDRHYNETIQSNIPTTQ